MIKYSVILLASAFLISGCISVDYEPAGGEKQSAPVPITTVKVFEDPAKVKELYHTIGYCIVSGNYRDFSKDDLIAKLRERAAEVGASGVVVKTYAVVPTGSERLEQLTDMQSMTSDTFSEGDIGVSGWNRLNSDFNSGYGSIREKDSVRTYSYKRIIRANFINYGPSANPKAAAPAKKDVKTIVVNPAPAKKTEKESGAANKEKDAIQK